MNNQIKEEGLTDAYLLGKYDGIKQGRADAIDEFIKRVIKELNEIAEDDYYAFDGDNANLVSSVLYGQQFEMEKGAEQ